jgi:hypothetical protein
MSLWRGILQQRRDEWASSLRGLDGIEAKPQIYNENIPVFAHHGAKLGFKKDLRTDEQAQKDFTPFVNKKSPEYLARMRNTEWLDSEMPETTFPQVQALFVAMGGRDAGEEYEAQDAPLADIDVGLFGDSDEEEDEEEPYEGYNEDMEAFEGLDEMELIENEYEPGTAMYEMVERRNAAVERYGSMMAMTYKHRQMETLSIRYQDVKYSSTASLAQKQQAYDNFLRAALSGGISERGFVGTWGERPEEPAMVGGGGAAPAPAPRVDASKSPEYIAWNTYRRPESGYLLGNKDLREILKAKGIVMKLNGNRAINRNDLITLLVSRGVKPPT